MRMWTMLITDVTNMAGDYTLVFLLQGGKGMVAAVLNCVACFLHMSKTSSLM